MPNPTSFAIDVVETGYRLGGTESAWFGRVLSKLEPELERGLGTFGVAYHFAGERLVLDQLVGHKCSDTLVGFVRAMYQNVSPPAARAMCGTAGSLASFSEFLRGLPAGDREAYSGAFDQLGFRDGLIVGYPDGEGGWLAFATFAESPIRTFPRQRTAWSRICAHLATAWRLRQRIGTAHGAIDAVVSPGGRVLDASGAATGRTERGQLAGAAKAIGKAKGALRRKDPDAALELWRGLVSGRWSLIDREEGDAETVLIAHQNDPRNPDPRGLSPRERAIVELVMTGAPSKQIAYTLGLSDATVATHLQRALRKLGLATRLELMRLGSLSGASVQRTEVGEAAVDVMVVGKGGADTSSKLTEAERAVAELVCEGLSNAEVGERRGTAERTVANQLASIFQKLGVGSRAELVLALSAS